MKIRKIAILGFGNIGQGVWDILHNRETMIIEDIGAKIEVSKILVRSKTKYYNSGLSEKILTTSFEDIAKDPEIEAVIELIGGIEPAYSYIKEAIIQGKHVVTANKAVLALYGTELLALAEEYHVSLRFEGSVGGGIPIIAALTQSLNANRIQELIGIVNGTTNYILTKMTKNSLPLGEALNMAQRKGYAEADPTSDLEGEDAAYKLSILANIAFGVQVDPLKIPREGITKVSSKDIEYAAQLGYTIKLLAKAKKVQNTLELHVHPALVPSDHPLAAVNNEFNALFVTGDAVGQLMFYGKGAGAAPTGSAVVSDLLNIFTMDTASHVISQPTADTVSITGETDSEYYVRLQVQDCPGVLGMITTIFGSHGVSLASVVQRGKGDDIVPLVFITHTVLREVLDKALHDIASIKEVQDIASILRVEK